MFLVKNEFPWLLYSNGRLIILTIIIYYKIDYKMKPEKAYFFELYGKYSLTIYFGHYICYLLPFELSYRVIGFAFLIFMFIIWLIMYLIDTKGKGKTSLEFLMALGARQLSNYMIKRSTLKKKQIK
jgi:fucose 4-O-acetylase-like acetyltransferase